MVQVHIVIAKHKNIIKNIVVIGGGTGTFIVLSALKKYPVNLTAIISMADDGGSTGILRDQYGVLPPGDVRRALVALSRSSQTLRNLFNYRFKNGDFHGHNFGNLFLSALEKLTGSFALAVKEAEEILNIKGHIIPVTLKDVRLYARLTDKTVITGESNIDIPKNRARAPIEKVWLQPKAKINPEARNALLKADLIILGPGDLYTSLIPNLLVMGMPEAIKKSKAGKVYIMNLMTKQGETHNYKANDFIKTVENHLGKNVLDYVIFNNKKPGRSILSKYKKAGSEFISPPGKGGTGKKPAYIIRDLLYKNTFIRHDTKNKLPKALLRLLK